MKTNQDAPIKSEHEAIAEMVRSDIADGRPPLNVIARAIANAEHRGACWVLASVLASLKGYPDSGGDVEVMREVERLRQEAADCAVRGEPNSL
jgi:hypothetical protein